MTKEDIYYFSLLSMLESIESGVTTINDMYFETEQIINAAEKAKINAVLGITLMDINGEKAGNKRIKNFGKLIEEFPNANISTLIHGLYTNSPKYLEKALAFGKKHNKNLVHMHFCENSDEVKTICEAYDVKHPGEVLEKYFKGLKLVLAHCVKIDSYTMKTLAKMNANVVHNPISNLRLGCGFADLKTMQEMNINICLGTDGQGSGSNMGILESMRLACLLPKGVNEDPTIITAYDALKMGTINGAKALGLEERKGSIDIGKDADLVFLNLEGTKTYPINDVVSDIVYNATESNIETVIINGKIVLKNKVHVKVNKKELLAKCAKLANDIKKR
jgi:5-methylthioadenosine/S-adenosylhomocysteine deaminase